MRKALFAALVLSVPVLASAADRLAEPIKLELKDFKILGLDGKENAEVFGYNADDNKLFYYTRGIATATAKFPEDGEYTLVLEASCDKAKDELAKLKIKVGDKVVKEDFALTTDGIKEYKFDVTVKKGEAKLSVEFLNDTYKEGEYDLNFYLHAAKFEKKAK